MKNNKLCSTPPLVENSKIVNDHNIFKNFFASKSNVPNYDEPASSLERLQNISPLASINTSPFELGKLIRNIKKSQVSHCGISGKFLSLIATPISFSMSRLYNNLFVMGHFPDVWKIAHISAIFNKSGPKTSKSSFRPISILPKFLTSIYQT